MTVFQGILQVEVKCDVVVATLSSKITKDITILHKIVQSNILKV